MTHKLPTIPRWRRLLHPRWWLTALVLAACAWPGWSVFAYFAAVSEVRANASWTGPGPFDFFLRIRFGTVFSDVPDDRLLVMFKGRDLKCIGHLLPRLRPTLLEAEECMAVDLDALKGITNLRQIIFRSCPALQNVDGIKGLTGLRYLALIRYTALENVDVVKGLTNLERLELIGCTQLSTSFLRDIRAGLPNAVIHFPDGGLKAPQP